MRNESPQDVPQSEFQQVLRREFLRRPWIARCMFITGGVLLGTLVLNRALRGHVTVGTHLMILAGVSLFGAAVGAAGFFLAPPNIRKKLPLLWGPAIVHFIVFFVASYRAWALFASGR